jgi:hypothetical protein
MEAAIDWVREGLLLSTTVAVKLNVPLALGVPDIKPVVPKERPAGNAPLLTDQV